MKKRLAVICLCAVLAAPAAVSAAVLNYEATINIYKQDNKIPQIFEVEDGTGKPVKVVAKEDKLYITAKSAVIRSKPGEKGEELQTVILGSGVKRVAVCDNGWSKVTYREKKGAKKIIGYLPDNVLSDKTTLKKCNDTVKVARDSEILDFPGRKDGEVVAEALELDELTRTGIVNNIWSRVLYQDDNGAEQIGYIPTNTLEGQEDVTEVAKADTEKTDDGVEAGIISKSEGKGIFAEAVEEVTSTAGDGTAVTGVQIGTPVSVSSEAALVPLGNFRITHYCPCSICCGPWANGITSTGVTATTNHTIAVDPTQIPYGSRVVINGQVYVAEDCGGAIKTNCIDIYVASHDEGESKGVYYTEVYLLQ